MMARSAPRHSARHLAFRFLTLAVIGLIVALGPTPSHAAAAPADRAVSKARNTSQAPATCRPKWPYIVLTCVA